MTDDIATVTDTEGAVVQDTPEEKTKQAKTAALKIERNPASKKQKKFVIVIRNQQGQTGKDPIFVGDNGRDFLLPRETEIEVTESMLNVLRDAISHETEQYKGDDGMTAYRQRPYQLYPFEIIKEIEG